MGTIDGASGNGAREAGEANGLLLLDPTMVVEPDLLRFRAPQSFMDAGFVRLKQSVAHRGGNVQPIKVRPIESGRYELVFGGRRLQACRELGLPVAAVAQVMSGQQQVEELDASNGDEQVSLYERGCLYEAALNAGYFPSRRRLAEALGRSLSEVTGAVTVAQLPKEILDLLRDPRKLKLNAARRIANAVATNPAALTERLPSARLAQAAHVKDVIRALSGTTESH